jgi:intracellular sulfur oxidation DsrE/DsrF family protein
MEVPMHRRNLLTGTFTAAGALLAAATSAVRAKAADPEKSKAVYHLTDLDKVGFVLGNIRNHFDGMGGPGKVTIALVVHGPALKAFHSVPANAEVTRRLGELSKTAPTLYACGNTMKSQNITLKDLPPGFVVAEEGGVVRIAELQAAGYVYLRP